VIAGVVLLWHTGFSGRKGDLFSLFNLTFLMVGVGLAGLHSLVFPNDAHLGRRAGEGRLRGFMKRRGDDFDG
jgi:hypothetical protein